MKQAYKGRLFWYLSVLLILLGSSKLPASDLASILGPGTFLYLAESIIFFPATILIFLLAKDTEPDRTFGLRNNTIILIIIFMGTISIFLGLYYENLPVGILGCNLVYVSGESKCLSAEQKYWETRQKSRRDNK